MSLLLVACNLIKMKKITSKIKSGYTIIETMIAISVFLVVIAYGMNALLSAETISHKSEDMRSILDNLSFIMEDMGRNLRTGSEYHCIADGNPLGTGAKSCPIGQGISFFSSLGGQWVYFINPSGSLSKSTDGWSTSQALTSSNIVLNSSSGFSVLGAEPPPGDLSQPLIKILLNGQINENGVSTPFSLQTSISQRMIDCLNSNPSYCN
jgi:prepilin-type N-terminal cleavage/methylation domain-containing protein